MIINCLTFTPIDLWEGNSSLKRTLASILTSVQWRMAQSSDRSRGPPWLAVLNTSKEVRRRFLFSSSLEMRALMDSPVLVVTTVVALSGKMTRVRVQPPLSEDWAVHGSLSSCSLDLLQCSQKLIDFLRFVLRESVRLCESCSSLTVPWSVSSQGPPDTSGPPATPCISALMQSLYTSDLRNLTESHGDTQADSRRHISQQLQAGLIRSVIGV